MKKILLVDDDEDILYALDFFLQRNDFNVVAVAAGSKVVEKVIAEQPDLILMDINLKGYDGRDICRELRRSYSITVPVVLFSAASHNEHTLSDCGATEFLNKPFDIRQIMTKIQTYLS